METRTTRHHAQLPLLLGVLILWAFLPPIVSGNEYLLDAGGGSTVGGPGEFIGKTDDTLAIHDSDAPRTLCVTLEGKAAQTRATFGPSAFDFTVTAAETRAVCRDEVETIELKCTDGDCESRWRVDAIP